MLEEERVQLHLTFGNSFKTRDFIGDSLQDWWNAMPVEQQAEITHRPLTVDHGPESSGRRTPFLQRMVTFADDTGKVIQLLYSPPAHSQYHPIERGWGILEQHWKGTLLGDAETMLEWAKSMTGKGIRPIVKLRRTLYQKGVSRSKKAMRAIEARLERNPLLPKWDILIRPV